MRLGNGAPPSAQRFKHRIIGTNHRPIGAFAPGCLLAGGLHQIFAQHDNILTTQNRPRGFCCHQFAVVFHRHIQGAAPNQLPRHTAPGGIGQILAHAEGGQRVMGELRHLIRHAPAQNIHHMAKPKALACAQHGGNHFLRGDGTIE